MKRTAAFLLASSGVLFALLSSTTACSTALSQPFEQMKAQPITIYRLQNYEPPSAAAGTAAPAVPGLPPQLQQWLQAGAAALPPGLIPPGLLPGAPAAAPASNVPRFHNFAILGTMAITDSAQRDEILKVFGSESSFDAPRQSCMFAEFGFQIGQGAAPTGPTMTPTGGGSADILVSLSCDQVQMFNYGWPYGTKTGLTNDTSHKIVAIAQRAFGG